MVLTEPFPSNNREIFTESLPSNDRGMRIQTLRLMGGFKKCAVEMGSVAMIYISSFIKIGSAIQKLMEEDKETHRHR
jgi:hypothetical protein